MPPLERQREAQQVWAVLFLAGSTATRLWVLKSLVLLEGEGVWWLS